MMMTHLVRGLPQKRPIEGATINDDIPIYSTNAHVFEALRGVPNPLGNKPGITVAANSKRPLYCSFDWSVSKEVEFEDMVSPKCIQGCCGCEEFLQRGWYKHVLGIEVDNGFACLQSNCLEADFA